VQRKGSETKSSPSTPEKKDETKSLSPPSPVSPTTPTTPTSPASAKKGFLAGLFSRSPKNIKTSTSEAAEIPEELKKQWNEFTTPKSSLTWVLMGYPDNKSRKAIIVGTGKGGLAELKTKLDSEAVQFGAFRVEAVDQASKRAKFVGFTLVGPKLSPSQRLQAMHVKEIQRDLWTGLATTLEIASASELAEDRISNRLIGVERGASSYDFGGGLTYEVSSERE